MQILGGLLVQTEFVMLLLAITGFYFVVAGIQYWVPNYMEQVLGVDKTLAASYFAFTCFCETLAGSFSVPSGGL